MTTTPTALNTIVDEAWKAYSKSSKLFTGDKKWARRKFFLHEEECFKDEVWRACRSYAEFLRQGKELE